MAKIKLSPTQIGLVEAFKAHPNQDLSRRPGGWWCFPDAKQALDNSWHPSWPTGTVQALFDRHVIVPAPTTIDRPFHFMDFKLSPLWDK